MNELQILSMSDIERAAQWVAKSGLFGIKDWTQAATLMMIAQAEGVPAVLAARDYHIIEGKPSLKAEAMLARFLAAGGTVEWHERLDTVADATFSHPSGGTVRVKWTIEMARAAGLAGRAVWKSYPRSLLHARCVSEGCRAVWPQATGHVYTPEEVEDMVSPGDYINGIADGPDNGSQPDERDWLSEIEACKTEAALADWWGRTKESRLALPAEARESLRGMVIAHRGTMAEGLNGRLQEKVAAVPQPQPLEGGG